MGRRTHVETAELPLAVAWENTRAAFFERLGPYWADKAQECRQRADFYCRRLQEET